MAHISRKYIIVMQPKAKRLKTKRPTKWKQSVFEMQHAIINLR
jgi:hypothetical protein